MGAGFGLGVGLLLPALPCAAACAASADWCVGLPIIVIAKGSSGDSGGGTLRSLFLSRSLREEDGGGRVLVSFRETEKGSVRASTALLSLVGRGGGGAQASGGGRLSLGAERSNAARKGSSGGMCLQLHTEGSSSEEARLWEKAGKLKVVGSTSGGARGERRLEGQALVESSCGRGDRPGEGSRNAARNGSEDRLKFTESLD